MTRSELMSRIKSKGNKSTELKYMKLLRRDGITGWRRHEKVMGVRPDFVFRKIKVAVFVDGCFWHACPDHCETKRLTPYWRAKVLGNRKRDKLQTARLADNDWMVVRIWEHELKEII